MPFAAISRTIENYTRRHFWTVYAVVVIGTTVPIVLSFYANLRNLPNLSAYFGILAPIGLLALVIILRPIHRATHGMFESSADLDIIRLDEIGRRSYYAYFIINIVFLLLPVIFKQSEAELNLFLKITGIGLILAFAYYLIMHVKLTQKGQLRAALMNLSHIDQLNRSDRIKTLAVMDNTLRKLMAENIRFGSDYDICYHIKALAIAVLWPRGDKERQATDQLIEELIKILEPQSVNIRHLISKMVASTPEVQAAGSMVSEIGLTLPFEKHLTVETVGKWVTVIGGLLTAVYYLNTLNAFTVLAAAWSYLRSIYPLSI